MSVKLSGGPPGAGDPPPAAADDIHWLPRSRLRSGGRGDRLLAGLTILTAAVLASAAGVAAWSRHGDLVSPQIFTADKAPDRAPAARAPVAPPPPAPVVRTVTPPRASPAPPVVERFEARADPIPAPAAESAAPAPAREAPTIRMTPEGEVLAAAPQRLASAPEPSSPPPASAAPQEPSEPLPPIPLSSAPPAAPPAPASLKAQDLPGFNPDVATDPPKPVREAARAERPAPQPAPAVSPPPASSDGKVAVYLDEYPDQKAAAAGLSQKSGAYGKYIGSAGKLTYTRRNGDWRLRVSNLDRSTAEALCEKLKGAGAPCSVGPN
ncbi:MAG: hypothetical protein ACK4MV_02865 [Beijerinckiaceae bacterium]